MGWRGLAPQKILFRSNQGVSCGEVHSQGEPGLFKKRLAESHTHAEREILLKLLAGEEAKEPRPKNGILKPR
jgi:hypothetical protein